MPLKWHNFWWIDMAVGYRRPGRNWKPCPAWDEKTANVVLNTLYGHPTIAVDTHVFRVANRTGLARGTTPLAVEQALLRAVPAPFLQHAHHWLILLGRHVCLARAPRCGACPIQDLCDTGKTRV